MAADAAGKGRRMAAPGQPVMISVVTPSYNQGQFLAQTIESVLSQEGEFSLDYIVVDGGSADNSVEVIRRYETLLAEGKWPVRCRAIRFRWMSERDRGQTDAIVKGFRLAQGEVFAWLNSDDTYLPGALRLAVEYLAAHPAVGMVHGKTSFTDAGGNAVGEVATGPTDYAGLAPLNLVCQPAAFFRKSVWDAVGGLDVGLSYTMDHDLWIRMAKVTQFGYIGVVLATYRLHGESKTVSPARAVEFNREILRTVMKYYHWAPANRVYGYCRALLMYKAPSCLSARGWLRLPAVLGLSLIMYLVFNRGMIRHADLRMLNGATLAKVRGGGGPEENLP